MPAFTTDQRKPAGRHQTVITLVLVVVAVLMAYIPGQHQRTIAAALQGTVLRPFVITQGAMAEVRSRAGSNDDLQNRVDSLVAVLSTHTALAEENRQLRDLLALRGRTGPSFRPVTLIRPGTAGSESMFVLGLGSDEGVRQDAPILTSDGLLGVVREVRPGHSMGMDWTHPDFRASAMTGDGRVFGIVESRRGQFREEDRLVLNGTPFHLRLEEGTPVVTSGLGGVFPRGIPIGTVEGLAEAEGGWRKAYWLRPVSDPGAAIHVLVAVQGGEARSQNLSSVWPVDSILHERYVRPREEAERQRASADSLTPIDSVGTEFWARGAELFARDTSGGSGLVIIPPRGDTAGARAGGLARPSTTPGERPSPTPATPTREEPTREAEPSREEAVPQPVIRNMGAVLDSLRQDSIRRAREAERRPPPADTLRMRPDTTPPDTTGLPPGGTAPPSDPADPRREGAAAGSPGPATGAERREGPGV